VRSPQRLAGSEARIVSEAVEIVAGRHEHADAAVELGRLADVLDRLVGCPAQAARFRRVSPPDRSST
jgi:hypothetical protein